MRSYREIRHIRRVRIADRLFTETNGTLGSGACDSNPSRWYHPLVRRRLFTLLSALSLLACLSAAGLSIRWVAQWSRIPADDPDPPITPIEVWPFALVFFSMPFAFGYTAVRLWRARGSRHVPLGCCLACGYDLRATSDRCPECGMETKASLIAVQSAAPIRR